jgi:STE24 endopeptidase
MKLNELKEGPLFDQLRHYQDHLHFKLNGIWVSDASQRSKKSNAFFTGFGRSRRLVLFDTLLQNHTDSEIVAVVAHEVGHYRLGHIWKGLFLSTMGIFVFLWLTESLVQTGLSFSALQLSHVVELPTSLTLPLNWILSFYLLHKATFFVTLITQAFSRKYEYQADAFAYQTTQDSQAMQRALLKLEKDNRSLPYSHPLYTALYASHPPVSERVKALDLLNQYPIEPILP